MYGSKRIWCSCEVCKIRSGYELAEKTGITKTQINNIEKGSSQPRPATFTKLVDALGLDRNEAANLL